MERHEYVRHSSARFFYINNAKTPNLTSGLPPFKDGAATKNATLNANPSITDYPNIERMARRISKLVACRLTGKDITFSWFTKQIQPPQFQRRLMYCNIHVSLNLD
jgi:hypothetical protein